MNDERRIDHPEKNHDGDSVADVITVVALVAVFVAVSIFWISSQ
jgi:hypothetical protein